MNILVLGRYALAVSTIGLVAACSGGGSQLAPSMPTQHTSGIARGSWMRSDAGSKHLLYISDPGTNDVQVYSYPKVGSPSFEGTLTGFDNPRGECVDATGDVWITNANASTIVKFAHAGTSPVATLSDPGQAPTSCAINAATGDLAVVNLMSGSRSGSVSIYKDAQGSPTTYLVAQIVQPLFISYDDTSRLFVNGLVSNGKPGIAEKRAKNNHFNQLGLSANIGSISGLQWDGAYLAVGDRTTGNNVIYRFGMASTKVNLKQIVQVNNSCQMMQFFVTATTVVVPDAECPSANTYKYPGGGLPMTKKLIGENLVAPFGSAISP
jgi:hypothetical protein